MPDTYDPQEPVTGPQSLTREEEQRVLAYWTPRRLAAAKPFPRQSLRETGCHPRRAENGPGVIGNPVGPDRADGFADGDLFTTTQVGDLNPWPYAATGKLFMTFGGQQGHVGTAWCIGESAIFTSGGNLYRKDKGWATNILFKGRYNGGSSVGDWAIVKPVVARGWFDNNEDYQYDIGAGIASSPIRPWTGKAGWMANYPPNQGPYTSLGYIVPRAIGWEDLWQCVGGYVEGDKVIQMDSEMNDYGGPWMVYFEGAWRANGLNSALHIMRDSRSIRISPYFGDAFLKLLEWIKINGGD